jgi:hypothetical protein
MRKKQYALLDHTAQVFLNSLVFTNDGEAIQWLTTQVNSEDKNNKIALYPESFTLYRLADYDDQFGTYHPRDELLLKAANKDNEIVGGLEPKIVIAAMSLQKEAAKSFTIKELISMLKAEISKENIIEIGEVNNG